MEDPVSTPGLRDAFVILGAAGLIIPAFHSLRLSPVIGFIVVGMIVGPFGLGSFATVVPWLAYVTITDRASIDAVAEIGIALLLFTIGLELSFERLRTMRRDVFGLGAAQLALCSVAIGGTVWWLGAPLATATVLGLALALSSSAIVLSILASEDRLLTTVGRTAFAMLLFQDLALAPILFGFSAMHGGDTATLTGLAQRLGLGAAAVTVIVAAGRIALRPLLRQAARTKSTELFLSASLVVVIGASVLTKAAGLSMLVGALLAGLLIAETEYHRQVHIAVEPFQGLLLGVFLISVGMRLDLALLVQRPLLCLAGVVALIAIKAAIVAAMLRLRGRRWGEAFHATLLMAPSSETSMILLTAAIGSGLIAEVAGQLALIVTALTLTLLPFLAKFGYRLDRADPATRDAPSPTPVGNSVIVLGYGRVGQLVANMLESHSISVTAVDGDIDRVRAAIALDKAVIYGDGSRMQFLERMDAGHARALVVTLDIPAVAERLVREARTRWPDLIIIARARDAEQAARLYAAGATDAVPETVESSLQLSEAVLVDVGMPIGAVIASIHEKRDQLRDEIKAMIPGSSDKEQPSLGRRRARPALSQ